MDAAFPAKLEPLFRPCRYKVLYGGRGGTKSWGAARALLIQGAKRPLRILCCREIQKSISHSVHALLSNQIDALNFKGFYEVQETRIIGKNGTEFTFHGLLHNVDNIKSAEGADICWVEEAQTVSNHSWEKLIPTIRKDGSEIWVTFNPELDTDPTYVRFVLDPPKNAILINVNLSDNPWAPQVLLDEAEELKQKDLDSYLTVYGGKCRQTLKGAVYADELRAAYAENRITQVPYDKTKGVHVFCDLGWSDNTSLWFIQSVAMQRRLLGSYQDQHKPWSHYLQYIQKAGITVTKVWLPPTDGDAKQLGTGKSILELTREAGYNAGLAPMLSVKAGINAVRETFSTLWFDEVGCSDGLQALKRYVWDDTPQGLATREPKHDHNSHYADGMRYLAVAIKEGLPHHERQENLKKKLKREVVMQPMQVAGWLGN